MTVAYLTFRLAAAQVILAQGSATALLQPVHSNDLNDPNASFAGPYHAKAELQVTITKSDALDFLTPGTIYDLVMIPRDSGYSIQAVAPPAALAPVTAAEVLSDAVPLDPVPFDPAPLDPPLADPAPAEDAAPPAAQSADPAPIEPSPVDPAPAEQPQDNAAEPTSADTGGQA